MTKRGFCGTLLMNQKPNRGSDCGFKKEGGVVKRHTEEEIRSKVLHSAAKLFLEKGYSESTTREIAKQAGINVSAMNRLMKSKENILRELVGFVLEGQFESTQKLLKGITEDKILFYAAETTLQLYMAESGEHIRELYAVSYSLANTMEVIQHTITDKLEDIFKEHLPHLETKDFFELEIASGGIMRGFMTMPCDMYFTMDRKVKRFLETTFLVYRVPQAKIDEAIEFVSQFDFQKIAKDVIDNMLSYLESKT